MAGAMFEPGKVVKEFEVQSKKVVFRYPKKSDVGSLMDYINELIEEGARIALIKKVNLEEEKKHVKELLWKMEKGVHISIVVEIEGKIAGRGDIWKPKPFPSAFNHIAEIGIGLLKEYRDMGIGTKLLKLLMKLAKKKWKTEIFKLSVVSDNERARHVYERLGFKETGKIPNGYKKQGKYLDSIIMVRAEKAYK